MPLGPTYSNNPDCSCIGHRVPGIRHIVPCCSVPHINAASVDAGRFWSSFDHQPVERVIKQFPHCDSRVLHAPGVCEFCDRHPEWQELRKVWKVNFTGCYLPNHYPCPAERERPLELIERWHGNVPETTETKKSREELTREVSEIVNELIQEIRQDASLDSCEGIPESKEPR